MKYLSDGLTVLVATLITVQLAFRLHPAPLWQLLLFGSGALIWMFLVALAAYGRGYSRGWDDGFKDGMRAGEATERLDKALVRFCETTVTAPSPLDEKAFARHLEVVANAKTQ